MWNKNYILVFVFSRNSLEFLEIQKLEDNFYLMKEDNREGK